MLKEQVKAKWFWLARWLCRLFCLLFFRMRTYGRENIPRKGPFVLISNHQSYLDPVLCACPIKRRVSFLARESLFTHWLFGRMITSVGTIPLKLGEADISAMRKVIDVLKQGRGACLFPEGTRSIDGKITPFKPGFGLLCRRGKAAVVPVVIDGAFESWPRHKKLFSPGSIVVCYGKAISAEQAKKMGDAKLAEVLTDTMRQMQTMCRIKQGKRPYNY
ncbi:MAG: 1-acyl-sn-glycerol-3-phosphate acyltransferase [Phycisphaerae bacterium]|nr:1-acyl-sn-glycerol-3-phosphate acyltransferase [Phycisphaerae bacterium]